MAITKNQAFVESKKVVLDDIKQAWFCDKEIERATDFNTESIELKELPLTEEGVNLNFGSANLTYKKTSTGLVWGSKVDRDDPEVSMNICNVHDEINEMFMEKKESTADVTIGEETFAAVGYASTINASHGSLWLPAENGEGWIVLPKITLFGTLNGTDDSNTGFYETKIVPATNADGCTLYFLSKTGTTSAATKFHVYIQSNTGNDIVADFWVENADEVVTKADAAGYVVAKPGSLVNKLVVKATSKKV